MADIGLGKILLRLLKMAIKSSLKAEASLDILIEQVSQACPSEEKIEQFIVKKNRINNSLTIIQKLITTTDFTTKTANKIISVLDKIIKLVKALPIPTSPIPIPINVITIASDSLDTAKNIIESGKGVTLGGVEIIAIINKFLQQVQDKLNQVELLLQGCIEQLPEEKQQELQTLLNTTSTDSSNPVDDKLKGEDLLAKLQPNSNDPLLYRGFRLQIEQNPNNPLETIPQRRVVGIQVETGILTVATDYSFASTTEVLVNEAKFLIDKWYISQETVTSNIDLSTIKILEDEPIIPEIPEIDISEADAAAKAAEEAAKAAADQAAAAAAEAQRQAEISSLKGQITGWDGDINMIKTQLTSAIDSVNFNKKNKAEWKGRVNSWLPQQWLGKKGINAYKRIDKKYGNLTGALNNWFNLNKKIKQNEDKIAKL